MFSFKEKVTFGLCPWRGCIACSPKHRECPLFNEFPSFRPLILKLKVKMEAYRYALQESVDCVEVDASRTLDGHLVALHDRFTAVYDQFFKNSHLVITFQRSATFQQQLKSKGR